MILANVQKHWDCIVAFKNGKTIQWFESNMEKWVDRKFPKFRINEQYRVKNIHQDIIDAHTAGAEVEFQCKGDTIWTASVNPLWNEDIKYRVALFAVEKAALKAGKEIQCMASDMRGWYDVRNPLWIANCEYRVKHKWQDMIDAQEAGKIIEAKQPSDAVWFPATGGWLFNSKTLEYRIKPEPKPEPKVIYVNEYDEMHDIHDKVHDTKEGAEHAAYGATKRIAVKYIEVLD